MSETDRPSLSYISYDDFLSDIEALAKLVADDNWRPDFLVGIGRGGLVPATYLSHRLDIKLISVDQSSGEAAFASELVEKLAAKTKIGARILLVDDINDSGATIASLRFALRAGGAVDDNTRFAVLINNIRSKATADYGARNTDRFEDQSWFVFPWEAVARQETIYEEAISLSDRGAKS